MSAPSERHKALVMYCDDRRCDNCPMNDPQLGCVDDEDACVVSLAMGVLMPEVKATP